MEAKTIASIVAGLVGGALVVAAPTFATAQTAQVSVAKYAEAVCGPLSKVKSADDAVAKRYASGPAGANFESQQAALDFVTGYQKVWADAAATLETISPSVRDGEAIGRVFVDHATKAVDEIQRAIDAFKTVDPTSRAYTIALASVGYAGGVAVRPRRGDPLRMVIDRSVHEAFKREKTCDGLFASLAAGPITEFPVSSRSDRVVPFEIAIGPDGHVWFTERNGDKIGKIDPATGKVTEFVVPSGVQVQAIAAGPDGNVWFTERDPNQIGPFGSSTTALHVGKIDPKTGKVTQFPIPTANPRPTGITAGPDGNVWFGERNGNQIGKIDPATGVVTLFPLPTANPRPRNNNAQPGKITAGPDGNLWFAASVEIGKIDPATGKVTMFPLPTANSRPNGITTGPDGKSLWFTDTGTNQIGTIDPATGKVTEFPIPTAAAGLLGISAGCDGNVWFTENNGNRVGKIDPTTGKVTELIVPTGNSQPTWIASGPDGNIWFTEEIADQIGKIDLGTDKNASTLEECRKPPKA